MASAKTKTIERVYNVPLRKEFHKVPRWRKTKKAAKALREFLVKHMKSENIKIGTDVNEKLWNHGIRNPPHHIKVTAKKDETGEVRVELFGTKQEAPSKESKPVKVEEKPAKKE